MMMLGMEPTDDAAAEAFVMKALEYSEHRDWREAIACLESAAVSASAAQLGVIIETLCSFYINIGEYEKLECLIRFSENLSPAQVTACLLLERNRQQGMREGQLTHSYTEVIETLVQYVTEGRYSFGELGVTCSLLAQIGSVELAVALLDGMISQLDATSDKPLDEELVMGVLTLALDCNMRNEAIAIVDKLAGLSAAWAPRVVRYRILLGQADLAIVTEGQDKVTDFLLYNAARA